MKHTSITDLAATQPKIMTDFLKIVDNLNIPKQIIDKSEALLKALFGQSLEEFGGLISDNVRLRRFKNQIKIFEKAKKILADKNIDSAKVSLKVLAPLLEYCSLEENLSLQNKWAHLVAFVLSSDDEEFLQANFIKILNLLHPAEAKILDNLQKEYLIKINKKLIYYNEKRKRKIEEKFMNNDFISPRKKGRLSKQANFIDGNIFSIIFQSEKYNIEREKFRYYISNMVSLGLLRWKIKIDDQSEKHEGGEIIVYDYTHFIFTPLGLRFLEVCNALPKK